MLKKLTQRGPKAYDLLVDIFKDLNYAEAHQILRPSPYGCDEVDLSIKVRSDGSCFGKEEKDVPRVKLEPYTQPVPRSKYNLKKATSIKIHDTLQTYTMKTRQRGVLFLVNMIDFPALGKFTKREGAWVDKNNMIDLFRQMGFTIFYYENLHRQQFHQLLSEFHRSQYLRRAECLVFGLLTHGTVRDNKNYGHFSNESGYLKTDGYEVEKIVEFFNNLNCQFLQEKPKVFLFPFCRGHDTDKAIWIEVVEQQVQFDGDGGAGGKIVKRRVATCSDVLICYGTVPGWETLRDPSAGSWYIQKFCEVIAEYAADLALEDMLKLIQERVGRMESGMHIQMPSYENWGFNKVLFFNPGHNG